MVVQDEKLIISKILKDSIEKTDREVLFLCIGSNKVVGDMLGPIVGSYLNIYKKINVLGNMNEPLTAVELSKEQFINDIKNKFVIVVDSAMGEKEAIGKIFISNKRIEPGNTLYKNLSSIGDISIRGCVCEDFKDAKKNYLKLKNVNINIVKVLADKIIKSIRNIYV